MIWVCVKPCIFQRRRWRVGEELTSEKAPPERLFTPKDSYVPEAPKGVDLDAPMTLSQAQHKLIGATFEGDVHAATTLAQAADTMFQ